MPAITSTKVKWFGGIAASPGSTIAFDLINITAYGGKGFIIANQSGGGTVSILNNHSHIIHNLENLSGDGSLAITEDSNITVPFVASLMNVGRRGSADVSATNNIFERLPCFQDPVTHNFKLQHEGEQAANGKPYVFNSPAIDAGLSVGTDMGAWQANRTLVSTTNLQYDLEQCNNESREGYDNVKLTGQRVNYEDFYDVKGGFHAIWDGINWKIEMDLSSEYFTGDDAAKNYLDMVRSVGLKRFYPNGLDGVWTYTGVTSGTDVLILVPAYNFQLNIYKYWVAKVDWDSGGPTGTAYVRIEANTATSVRYTHLYGSPIPVSSTVTARLLYLPCELDLSDATNENEYYINDESWHKASSTDKPSEFHQRSIVFRSVSEKPQ